MKFVYIGLMLIALVACAVAVQVPAYAQFTANLNKRISDEELNGTGYFGLTTKNGALQHAEAALNSFALFNGGNFVVEYGTNKKSMVARIYKVMNLHQRSDLEDWDELITKKDINLAKDAVNDYLSGSGYKVSSVDVEVNYADECFDGNKFTCPLAKPGDVCTKNSDCPNYSICPEDDGTNPDDGNNPDDDDGNNPDEETNQFVQATRVCSQLDAANENSASVATIAIAFTMTIAMALLMIA